MANGQAAYARVRNGVVQSIENYVSGFVPMDVPQAGLFFVLCDGRPEVVPGWTYAGGGFASPPIISRAPMSPAELATQALASGLAITSASTPAINATYSIDASSQAKINAVSTYVLVNSKFPGGASATPWVDATGVVRTFPSVAVFQAFASAAADYVQALEMIRLVGTGTLPPASRSIL